MTILLSFLVSPTRWLKTKTLSPNSPGQMSEIKVQAGSRSPSKDQGRTLSCLFQLLGVSETRGLSWHAGPSLQPLPSLHTASPLCVCICPLCCFLIKTPVIGLEAMLQKTTYTTGRKLKYTLLSERSQSGKATCCRFQYMTFLKRQTVETVKGSVLHRDWERGMTKQSTDDFQDSGMSPYDTMVDTSHTFVQTQKVQHEE